MSNSYVEMALANCQEYADWSNAWFGESLKHYEDDEEYLKWADQYAESVGDPAENDDVFVDDQGMTDEDWIVLKREWESYVPPLTTPSMALSEEVRVFYDHYCY